MGDIVQNMKQLEASDAGEEVLEKRRTEWGMLEHKKKNLSKKIGWLGVEVMRKKKENGFIG